VILAKRPTHDLVHCVVPADVFANAQELAFDREETSRVQSTGDIERSLRCPQPSWQLGDHARGYAHLAFNARRFDGDGFERALAANAARRAREEVALDVGRREVARRDFHGIRGQVKRQRRLARREAFREAEAERELLIVPWRPHGHRDGLAVDADLERLLDRDRIPFGTTARKSNDLDS
jgi:hypothetical protein